MSEMRKWMRVIALIGVIGVVAASCGSDEEAAGGFKQCEAGETDGDLAFFNWSEYMDPDLITAFQDEFGVTVTEDFYPSNEEMFAKISHGGTGYDISSRRTT